MSDSIERLEELYEKINVPEFHNLSIAKIGVNTFYKAIDGIMQSVSVLSEEDISIAKTTMTEGTEVQLHRHKSCKEVLIILSGELEIRGLKEETIELKKHDILVIEKNKPHSGFAKETTVFIALTVPNDKGFPK